ncbi:hypothetical protein COLO4_05127 [Corchorus olitorius]|uniref:Uncharacterized protein n=1 Tax=Corchorus olitorius TaxID=93759 RepID=A0A1R3KRT7_9ROSI|nr:hypothetical protein COLO4_05127 [Corchorus olitorius]
MGMRESDCRKIEADMRETNARGRMGRDRALKKWCFCGHPAPPGGNHRRVVDADGYGGGWHE